MKTFYRALPIVCFSICFLAACSPRQTYEKVRRTDTAMGTIIQQSLYLTGESADRGAAADAVMEEIGELETGLLSWRLASSEVYRLNRSAGGAEGLEVSAELGDILRIITEVAQDSGGALDVTVGHVAELWDIDEYASGEREGFRPPREEEIRRALEDTGYESVRISGNRVTLPEGMKLDLGAVGKGLACARLAELLPRYGEVTGAVISVGGSVLTYGRKPDGKAWSVGIVNPKDTGSYLGFLELDGQWFVSTSGDYERYVESDGIRYHHILDPSTGYPADSGVSSVTILCGEGLLSDALSTACFVLGREKGLELARQYGAEALFVDREGEIYMTEGMKKVFRAQP